VPELQKFIQVNPISFSAITKGQTNNLTLTFSASQDALLGTFDGTVHLKVGPKNIAKPIPVVVNVWRSVTEKGLVLNYPPEWQRNTHLIEPQQPISLNTFNSAYGHGGIIPKGGAEISITAMSLQTSSLTDEMARDSIDTTVQSTSTISVAGIKAQRIVYLIPFGSLFTYLNVIVYVPHEATLYKFSLLYYEKDPRETEFLTDFQRILDTVHFM
jgi:hypothetical protein